MLALEHGTYQKQREGIGMKKEIKKPVQNPKWEDEWRVKKGNVHEEL